jgi:signal transduction histidine kinase
MPGRVAKEPRVNPAAAPGQLAVWAQSKQAASEKPNVQYRSFLKQLRKAVPFQAATLRIRREPDQRLTTVVEIDGGAELIDFVDLGLGSGLSGYSAEQGRPVLLNRQSGHRLTEGLPFECFVSLPLLWLGEVPGVLNLGLSREEAVSDAALPDLLAAITPLAALVAQNALQLRCRQLTDDYEESQSSLSKAGRGLEALAQVAEAAETAASVVHQINNPLAVVIGNIQCLIAERAVPNQKALSRLKRAENAALAIAEVNRRLLHIHAMHQGKATGRHPGGTPGQE